MKVYKVRGIPAEISKWFETGEIGHLFGFTAKSTAEGIEYTAVIFLSDSHGETADDVDWETILGDPDVLPKINKTEDYPSISANKGQKPEILVNGYCCKGANPGILKWETKIGSVYTCRNRSGSCGNVPRCNC